MIDLLISIVLNVESSSIIIIIITYNSLLRTIKAAHETMKSQRET